jgi:subtilisin family serine protease
VWTISLNRRAIPALKRSVPAVKADAARTLFTVDCSQITWAVIDSGIDATHPAFADARGAGSRVKKSFDFTTIRDIVSLDNLRNDAKRRRRVAELLARPLKSPPTAKQAEDWLKELAGGAQKGRSIDWEIVERLVEIDPGTPTLSNHGTHVAGIIGADKKAALQPARIATAKQADKSGKAGAKRPAGRAVAARAVASRAKTAIVSDIATQPEQLEAADADASDCADGMCPDIRLYDFRVLAPTLAQTEFSVIAALQYIRYVNERNSYITIHGANLSLSIPHDVRNYACGRTPVCNECERLVASGVVVVVAAGNRGYQHFETKEGLYESYAAFSITDPGNADGVITVGATHRFWPHTYGVSFFSSRGPTGDGRMKPDLVAPGERIRAPLPDNQWGDLDGTSMAAPHVSGAAAMLMARYSELIGEPRRVKQILCQSATDLARERSFQGHGMLDVLRAFQSI